MVAVPSDKFEQGIEIRRNLIDSIIMASSLRLNFVEELSEAEKDLEIGLKQIAMPDLMEETAFHQLCVGDFYPVLIAHRVVLKHRPSGFMTAKSTLKHVDLSYQLRVITKLFTASFIASKREFEIRRQKSLHKTLESRKLMERKRKCEEILETRKKRKANELLKPQRIEVPDISEVVEPSPPQQVRATPSSSVVVAQRKPVHSMPALNWKRIPVKRPENVSVGLKRRPVVLPVYSMLSSSDDDSLPVEGGENIRERRHEVELHSNQLANSDFESGDDQSDESDGSVASGEYEILSGECSNSSEKAQELDTTIIDDPKIVLHPSASARVVQESSLRTILSPHTPVKLPLRSLVPDEIATPCSTIPDSTALDPMTSSTFIAPMNSARLASRHSPSLSSFTMFLSDARKLPEKLLGKFWAQPTQLPEPSGPDAEDEVTEVYLMNPNQGPNHGSSSLSRFLSNIYKRGENNSL